MLLFSDLPSTFHLPSNYIFSPVHVIDWFHVIKYEFWQRQPVPGMTFPGEGFSQGEEERPGRAERERAWSPCRTRGGGRPCCNTGGKHWISGERWDRLIKYIPFLHLSISITEIKGPCWSPVNPEIPIRHGGTSGRLTQASLSCNLPNVGNLLSSLLQETEEWSKLPNRLEEGQVNSRHQSQSGLLRPDCCESLPLIRRNIAISEGMVAPPPNYETHHNYPMI